MFITVGIRENVRKELGRQGYGNNLRKFAQERGLSKEYSYLNQFLNKRRRFNEDMLTKISEALNVPLYSLFADEPLVPYKECEPTLKRKAAETIAGQTAAPEVYEPVKLFNELVSLGPGYELSEMNPDDWAPILKRFLPRGFRSDHDRMVAYRTEGVSMRPTINSWSIVWIDRADIVPKEGEIYAFLLPDKTITIKRLMKIHKEYLIIDGDNQDKDERRAGGLKDYPMSIRLTEGEESDYPVRGRVIWALNRFIEKPKE